MSTNRMPPALAGLLLAGLLGAMPRGPQSRPRFSLDDLIAGHATEDAFAGHHPEDVSAADHVEGRVSPRAALDIDVGPDVMTFLVGPEGRVVDITDNEELTEALDRMLGGNEPVTENYRGSSAEAAASDVGRDGPDLMMDPINRSMFTAPLGRAFFPDLPNRPGAGSHVRATVDRALRDAENALLKRTVFTQAIMLLQVIQAMDVPVYDANDEDTIDDMVAFLSAGRDSIPD
jgi:hypothetical protein